ncbi:MAG TPA: hypothetical protein VG917_05125 [Patescibacteria group bacterium]|nr:hypothetical protein [Patescibacteria group bacterium]
MNLLKKIWSTWLKVGKKIGNFQAQVLFTIFYFLVLFPVGLAIGIFSDSLNIKQKKKTKSNFDKWDHPEEDIYLANKPY